VALVLVVETTPLVELEQLIRVTQVELDSMEPVTKVVVVVVVLELLVLTEQHFLAVLAALEFQTT
jgi:hypothetical protein